MKLESIPSKTRVFIDANIFIYHFTGVSTKCSDFLNRCERSELEGITSTNVLLEVLHRLMMVEAVIKKLIKPPNLVKKLNKHPEIIKQLEDYFINTQKIVDMGIVIKPISFETILRSYNARTKYGLMINDSILVASMQDEDVTS